MERLSSWPTVPFQLAMHSSPHRAAQRGATVVTKDRPRLFSTVAGALAACGVELRFMPVLTPLRDVWSTSLHASGIRLRNAKGWLDHADA